MRRGKLVLRRERKENADVPMLYSNICTKAPTRADRPTIAGISTLETAAAPLVPLGDALEPVPVPGVLWTLVLLEAQKYEPLMIDLSLSVLKGSQLIFPELCMLKVPLQSARAGRVALYRVSTGVH